MAGVTEARHSMRSGRLVLATVIVLALASMRFGMSGWYAREIHRAGTRAAQRGALDKERRWLDLPYVDVDKISLAEVLDRRIRWESLNLTSNQCFSLRIALREVACYLQKPTFDEYYRLRIKSSMPIDPTPTDPAQPLKGDGVSGATQSLMSISSKIRVSAEEGEQLKLLWNRIHSRNGSLQPPRISGICPIYIAASISTSNSALSLVHGGVAKGFTAFVEHLSPPFVHFHGSPDGPFFHLSFYAKVGGRQDAGPVYLSLSWSFPDQSWDLGGLITDTCLHVQTIF